VKCGTRRSRRKYLEPREGGYSTPTVLFALQLVLEGSAPEDGVINTWTDEQRRDAYDWAMREHLRASDNPIRRRPKPAFLEAAP
jgi:hypothetical protein